MVLLMEPAVEGQRSAVIKLSGELVRLRTSVLIYGCNSNASAYILDTGCSIISGICYVIRISSANGSNIHIQCGIINSIIFCTFT